MRVENSAIAGEANSILLDPIDFLRGFSVLKDELVRLGLGIGIGSGLSPKGTLARHTVVQRADAHVSLFTGCFRVYVNVFFHVDGSQIGPEFFGQASLRRATVLHCELLRRAHTPSLVYRLQRL